VIPSRRTSDLVRVFLIRTLRALLVLAFTLTTAYLVIWLSSKQPGEAFSTLLFGPLSSRRTMGNWIDDTTKLTLAGLAFSLVFQARQFSLGSQGQVYLGGLAAGLVALSSLGQSWLSIPIGLLAAASVGAVYGFIPGILKARLGANEIVSSLMLNYIAIDVFAFLIRAFIAPRGGSLTTSSPFPVPAVYPALIPNSRIDLGLLIALAASVALWFVLYRTRWGYELRMTGFNLKFAEYAGINVPRKIASALAFSGLIAGILGATLVQGQSFGELAVGFESGITFDGLLIAIIARNHPLAVPIAALVYGYFRQGATLMGFRTDVPVEVIGIVQGLVILVVASHGMFSWLEKLGRLKPGATDANIVTEAGGSGDA
jgi:general nucleoside transport system permease protein